MRAIISIAFMTISLAAASGAPPKQQLTPKVMIPAGTAIKARPTTAYPTDRTSLPGTIHLEVRDPVIVGDSLIIEKGARCEVLPRKDRVGRIQGKVQAIDETWVPLTEISTDSGQGPQLLVAEASAIAGRSLGHEPVETAPPPQDLGIILDTLGWWSRNGLSTTSHPLLCIGFLLVLVGLILRAIQEDQAAHMERRLNGARRSSGRTL